MGCKSLEFIFFVNIQFPGENNKTCAQETVACMVEDLAAGNILSPEAPEVDAAKSLIESRKPDAVSYPEWQKIDAEEVQRGEAQGRPRVKFTDIDEMRVKRVVDDFGATAWVTDDGVEVLTGGPGAASPSAPWTR